MMTYEEAVEFLNAPKYSETRPGLGPVTELMERLGNPQDQLEYVHIAGTNGKGSTAAYMDSVLRAAGYRTGLYTSPFLEQFSERIRVNGESIGNEELARITTRVRDAVEQMEKDGSTAPTIFEMVTAVAFLYFLERQCDIVVLEVGMGGRLDATNIIRHPEVSIITKLGMDHMNFLGNTLGEIAWEKAGIMKQGTPCVSWPQEEEAAAVLVREGRKKSVPLTFADLENVRILSSDLHGQRFRFRPSPENDPAEKEIHIGMLGEYQVGNAVLALTALETMKRRGWKIPEPALERGMEAARWPGRFERLMENPLMIIDGAHNPDGVGSLVRGLQKLFPEKKLLFVAGVLADKDYDTMFRLVRPLAEQFFCVTPESHRALPGADLAARLREGGSPAEAYASVPEAVDAAVETARRRTSAGEEPVIVAFGSLYYIGEVRTYVRKQYGVR